MQSINRPQMINVFSLPLLDIGRHTDLLASMLGRFVPCFPSIPHFTQCSTITKIDPLASLNIPFASFCVRTGSKTGEEGRGRARCLYCLFSALEMCAVENRCVRPSPAPSKKSKKKNIYGTGHSIIPYPNLASYRANTVRTVGPSGWFRQEMEAVTLIKGENRGAKGKDFC